MELYYHAFAVLPCMVCLVWAAILWLEYRRNDVPRRVLAVFALVCTVLYACHYVHFAGPSTGGTANLHSALWRLCNLSVYPLFWLYIRALTDDRFEARRHLWVFIPAVAVFAAALGALLLSLPGAFGPIALTARILFGIEVLAVFISGRIRIAAFERRIREFYADTEPYSIRPVRILLLLFVLTSLSSVVFNFIGRDLFLGRELILLPALLFSLLLFAVFLVGFRLPFSPDDIRRDRSVGEAPVVTEEIPVLPRLMERIDAVVRGGELFRRPGLKISDVAQAVGSNRTYISNAINHVCGLSFSDYVNRLRIDAACALMESGNVSVAEVSRLCGYTDRTSFYRSFKKFKGLSPSEYPGSLSDQSTKTVL